MRKDLSRILRSFDSHSINQAEKEVRMAICPECEGTVDVDVDVEEGEILECPECGVELEVLSTNPLELGIAPQEEEDWGE
jgi:alpha-aminoadipate/glutamate carrier protein LysW